MPFDYVAVDLETANPQRGSICQIGLVRVRDGVPVRTLSTLVKPEPAFGRFARANIAVHGITPRDVAEAPRWAQIVDQVRAFVGADLLVAHNATFERSCLQRVCTEIGVPVVGEQILCTVELARKVLPHLQRHKLPLVLAELGREPGNHHDALADAMDSAIVLQGLAERAGARSGAELIAATGVALKPMAPAR